MMKHITAHNVQMSLQQCAVVNCLFGHDLCEAETGQITLSLQLQSTLGKWREF